MTIMDASELDDNDDEFYDPHRLDYGQCCAHYHAIQTSKRAKSTHVRGIEPVDKLFTIYRELVTKLLGEYAVWIF